MLALARGAITSQLNSIPLQIPPIIPPKLKEKRACFVTLMINGQLRGCIGHILPIQELYKDIMENARAAAFDDSRFPPLTHEELEHLAIEISVLTIPQPYPYQSIEGLLDFLSTEKPGVILSVGPNHATFLPAVWNDIPQPEDFLDQLSLKAGLRPHAWKQGAKIQCYHALTISD